MTRKKISEIIEPHEYEASWSSRIYDYVMLTAIVVSIIPLMFRGEARWMAICDVASCSLFVIDYFLRWIVADKIMKKPYSFVIYPFSFMAIIDLVSILPALSLLNPSFKLFRIARLVRILRVIRFIRYYKPLQIMITVIRKEASTLMTVLVFSLFYIFVTALIMFNAEQPINEAGEMVFEDFFDSLYWAACTLTTVGYGDICPVTDVGRVIGMISAIVGVAIIALPSGIITAAYLEELKDWKSVNKGNSDSNSV